MVGFSGEHALPGISGACALGGLSLRSNFFLGRLQKNDAPRDLAVRHLEEYLETKVRARKSKTGAGKA